MRDLLEYLVVCYAAGVLGAFATAFLALRNERLCLSHIWKTLMGAGIYSLALSKLFQLVLTAFIHTLIVEPPYPLGFLIGALVAYLTIKPTEDKSARVLSVANGLLGKFGLKLQTKDDDDD